MKSVLMLSILISTIASAGEWRQPQTYRFGPYVTSPSGLARPNVNMPYYANGQYGNVNNPNRPQFGFSTAPRTTAGYANYSAGLGSVPPRPAFRRR